MFFSKKTTRGNINVGFSCGILINVTVEKKERKTHTSEEAKNIETNEKGKKDKKKGRKKQKMKE